MSLVLDDIHVKRNYKFEIDELPLIQKYLDGGRKPLLLYPGEGAISLDNVYNFERETPMESDDKLAADTLNKIKKNKNLLIVIDGTWFEAQRMANASPWLFDVCQQVQFTAPASCIYDAVRKEPEGHCLSTLEACAQTLILLESAVDAASYLTGVLQLMVDIQLYMEKQRHDDPRQKGKQLYERNRRRRQVEKTLFEKAKASMLEDGAVLRSLNVDDASILNKNWYHQSKRSLRTIEQRLENGLACFGIEKDGELCAYVMRSEDGTLGMLYVQEDCRRNGYGRALVQEATRVLRELDKPCVCFIRRDNVATESLFQSAGWVVAKNSDNKAGTKVSKRKWVFLSKH
jgi:DTW domain-containing protein YfiP/GNAT superfamily N-acetyltransferase